ncbi:hypothetical protein ACHAXT_009766 [Thalassiosira profunda]
MVNPIRRPSPLLAAAILAALAPAARGWMPFSRRLTSSRKFLTGANPTRQSVQVSATNNDAGDDAKRDDGPDDTNSRAREEENPPLFAEGDFISNYLSRLEALYDRGSDSFVEDHTTEEAGKARRLLQEGDRVILGDWMEWDEGPCSGDSCGEEEQCDIPDSYKVDAPKVDVMAFLGIKRAEPLHAQRDWD